VAEFDEATGHPSDEVLAAFLDRTLDERLREEVLGHLAECDDCRAFVADWARVAASTGKRGNESGRVGDVPVKMLKDEVPPRTEAESAPGHKCPHCRKQVAVGAAYCPYCGMNISAPSTSCANCGRKINATDTYCRYCGAPLTAETMRESADGLFNLYEYGSLIAGIISFMISFFVHGYFWQFLIACGAFMGLYIYFRMKREVMLKLIDALRSGDRSKEEEILKRLRRRFKA
jgi:hypothetical protein